jgi:hypothetical protein
VVGERADASLRPITYDRMWQVALNPPRDFSGLERTRPGAASGHMELRVPSSSVCEVAIGGNS